MWASQSESIAARNYNGVLPDNHGIQTDKFEKRGQSWYTTADIPSDFIVQIGEISFHLHKFPLLSKSGKIERIIFESREIDLNKVILDELPGGHEAFELAAKFCYGIAIEQTATTIGPLRCAAEYLEMTEDFEEGNLIIKTEAFLNYVVLSSWKDSITVLQSCENLSPWAENLQIVRRCSESVAWKAYTNPNGLKWPYPGEPNNSSPNISPDWWYEDVSVLRIDHFVRVVTALKVKGMKHQLVGDAIMHYAMKLLPGMIKDGSIDDGCVGDHHHITHRQRTIIESLISIIPQQNDSVSCSFLLRLLRIAKMINVSPALVTELEKRVGMQLEKATLADLLIPSYNRSETKYDVNLVQRLLEHFLIQEQMDRLSPDRNSTMDRSDGVRRSNESDARTIVARLVDNYLAEVSRDNKLSLTSFQVLAEALPESARSCDDGLYRAIDSYLKVRPMLLEHERRRLCRLMDCQKLSMDACTHAAQNERLPVRVSIQVILSEQIKLHNALASASASASFKEESDDPHYQPVIPNRNTLLEETPQSFQDRWAASAIKDIKTLKFDLDTVKTKYLELQHDMEMLQRQTHNIIKLKHQSSWSSGWKKLSKLTKISSIDNTGIKSQGNTEVGHVKTPRRWRNSLS